MHFQKFILLITCFLLAGYVQAQKINYQYFETSDQVINDICFTKTGALIGITDNTSIKIFATDTQELIAEFVSGHTGKIQSIDISNDSSMLISGGRDSSIVIWDFINKSKLKTLSYQQSIITVLKISPCGKFLITGGESSIYIYDMEQNKLINKVLTHKGIVTDIAFTKDGKAFASSSAENSINIYDLKTGNLLAVLNGHKSWVRSIVISDDGKLYSCGDDSRVIIWDISDFNNPRKLNSLKYGSGWLLALDLSFDNNAFAFADMKGNFKIVGRYATFKAKVNVPVNKLLIVPNKSVFIKTALATRGKGVLLIDANDMKSKN